MNESVELYLFMNESSVWYVRTVRLFGNITNFCGFDIGHSSSKFCVNFQHVIECLLVSLSSVK